MGEKNNRLESIIALSIVVFFISVLVFVYYKYSGHSYQKSYFYAEFDSISGLNVGCPVKINGVNVGKVERFSIDPKKNFVVVVSFSVDRHLPLPEDTRASVGSESLFGSPILTLLPGISEENLSEGAVIVDTQSPLQMTELLQKFLFNSSDANERDGNTEKIDSVKELDIREKGVKDDVITDDEPMTQSLKTPDA